MKILILPQKTIHITLFFLAIVFLISSFLFRPLSFAQEIKEESFLTETMKEKFKNITKNSEKIAYLTFDDGPTTKATSNILDILKEEEVKATFFVVGKHVKENPELVKREFEEGHYIANHGYNHNNKKLYANENSFISEVKTTDFAIGEAIGVPNYCSHIFRFPNGYMSPNYKFQKKQAVANLEKLDYTYVDWNCLNKDSEKKISKAQLLNNLKKSSKNKGTLVILMHDTNDVNNTVSILKDSIFYLKNQGYEFRNFYDLITNE